MVSLLSSEVCSRGLMAMIKETGEGIPDGEGWVWDLSFVRYCHPEF